MRILMLTQYYPPETGAPQARLAELGRRLHDMGHAVTVLTAMPNYPTGRVFAGYHGVVRKTEEIDGIRVVRTWIHPSNSTRTIPRLFTYVSFAVSASLAGVHGIGKQDIVLVESPPLFLAPVGVWVRRLTGGRLVFNVSDIWPDIIVRMGHTTSGPWLRALFWLERFAYRHADVVALTNPGAATQIRTRFPHTRVTVISNGVDTQLFRPQLRSTATRRALGAGPGDFLAGYCGLLGMAQGLEVVVDAAALLRDRPDIKIFIMGDGPVRRSLRERARKVAASNLLFYERKPKNEIPGVLAACDASIVPLAVRLPGTMPSKIYEALASGVPPLVAKGCEAEHLVVAHRTGCAFEPMNGKALAELLRGMADNPTEVRGMRANCLRLARRFDRDTIARRTEAILQAIVAGTDLPETEW